jgi:alkyl hydroperoxide reductase subunit AhpF
VPLLNEQVRGQLRSMLADLRQDVELRLHPGPEGEASDVMRQLVEELAEVSRRLVPVAVPEAPVVEPGRESDAEVEGPVLLVAPGGAEEARVRFLGVTAGHEFGALVAAIRHAGEGATELSAPSVERLGAIEHRVHVQVFTTPT